MPARGGQSDYHNTQPAPPMKPCSYACHSAEHTVARRSFLGSLALGTGAVDRILVVDDGSEDGTRSRLDRLKAEFPQLDYVTKAVIVP